MIIKKLPILCLFASLFLSSLSCASLKAVTPPELEEGKSWNIDAPQNISIVNSGRIKRYAAGPYVTSKILFDEFSGKASKSTWSKSTLTIDGNTHWLSFSLMKGDKKISSATCERFIKSTKYSKGTSSYSIKSGEKSCEIVVGNESFIMTFSESAPVLKDSNGKVRLVMTWSHSVSSKDTFRINTGLQFFYKKGDRKPFAWIKTLKDGEPSRLVIANNVPKKDEATFVTTALAFLSFHEFACDERC